MKSITVIAALLLVSRMNASNPVTTYTFVDPCTPFVAVNAAQDKHGCFFFTATNGIQPGQSQGNYQWQFGGGATASGSHVAHCYSPEILPVVYTGTVTYTDATCSIPGTSKEFTVMVPAAPTGSCLVSSPEVLESAQSVTVLGGVIIPELIRSINYGDGSGFVNSPEHTYTGCGPFVITVKSWDMNLPDVICYAYHATNIVCKDIVTGIREDRPSDASVYPNPCKDHLIIETKKTPVKFSVIDILGKTRSIVDNENKVEKVYLSTESLDSGIFFVKIEYLDKSAEVFKIMKY